MSAPLSLREEAELRARVQRLEVECQASPQLAVEHSPSLLLLGRLLATLAMERREREAALTALRAEEQRNGLVTAKCDSLLRERDEWKAEAVDATADIVEVERMLSALEPGGPHVAVAALHDIAAWSDGGHGEGPPDFGISGKFDEPDSAKMAREALWDLGIKGPPPLAAPTPATAQQPAPTVNDSPEVWPEVIQLVHAYLGPLPGSRLKADMRARDALGRQKYGTPLRRDNGRSALTDAYQEALDLAAYLQQLRMQTTGHGGPAGVAAGWLRRVLELCLWLRDEMSEEQAVPR